MYNRTPKPSGGPQMFRKLFIVTAVAVAVVLTTAKPASAQYAAPQLFQKIEKTAKTNSFPYTVTNITATIGVTFTNGTGRAEVYVNCSSATAAGATNTIDLIDQTDATTNSWNFGGLATNVLDFLSMAVGPKDVIVVSTNRSTAGTGVAIISTVIKQ